MIRLNTPIESIVINLQSAGEVNYNIQYVFVRNGVTLNKSVEGILTTSGQHVVLINDYSSGYFDITYLNITNIDPAQNYISVLKKTNVNETNLTSEAIGLKNRECIEFTSDSGFKTLDQNGSFKTITSSVAADGDVENSDMSYMATVPSGGSLTLPDSQINVNGIDEGDVVSVKLIDVNLTDGVDIVVPTSVGLVANTLTITLAASSDVDIEINGAPYDTVTAPATVDIPVINSALTPVGTINVLDVEIGDSSVTITDSASTLLHTVTVAAEDTDSQVIADSTVANSDASYSVNVLAEGSLTLPDQQINVNSVDEGDIPSVGTIDIDLSDGVSPVTPTSVTITGRTVDIVLPPSAGTFMTATGGTVTTDGDYKIHTFTSSGDFEVLTLGDDPKIDFLLVAGGASGAKSNGSNSAGGGGAGGLIYVRGETIATIGIKPIVVGNGGAARTTVTTGANGGNSTFLSYTAIGGGGGGTGTTPGLLGGSGGGGAYNTSAGAGTSGQGFGGGAYIGADAGCGGGGAGQAGLSAFSRAGGTGGIGRQTYINGTTSYFAGGGGGSPYASNPVGVGGVGGGGNGGRSGIPATAGTANTGGGGGGGYDVDSGAGGSGVCIIRYKYQ